MPTKVLVVFHSLYGHIFQLAEAIAAGAKEVPDSEVQVYQVEETFSDDILGKMGAVEAKKAFAHIPIISAPALAEADAIIIGSPTRFGMVTSQMQSFLDTTGGLWAKGALIGKVGGSFTSSASQHGGQETTLIHMHTFFYHHGLVVCGVPYAAQGLAELSEVSGGSPYGSSTISGPRGERTPTENELSIARFQGRHVTQIAAKLAAK